MKYLLDTNAVIALLKGDGNFAKRIRQFVPEDFALSAIVAHELFYGAYKSRRRKENLARIDGLYFEVLEFDREDALCSGHVRAALAERGSPIGPYDVLIAGQALARSLTLITGNSREFERVNDLKIENWQA